MEREEKSENTEDLSALCVKVRELIGMQDYKKCESLICGAMEKYPHAAEPHNLIGILLEKKRDHLTAMKHFRAAWALDPTYLPARQNLDCYGTFFSGGRSAYDESDCTAEENAGNHNIDKVEYGANGVGRSVRRD